MTRLLLLYLCWRLCLQRKAGDSALLVRYRGVTGCADEASLLPSDRAAGHGRTASDAVRGPYLMTACEMVLIRDVLR